MLRRVLLLALAVLIGTGVIWYDRRDRAPAATGAEAEKLSGERAFDTAIPPGVVPQPAATSNTFFVDATARFGASTQAGKRQLIYSILVTNKTPNPVRRVSIAARLDDQMVQLLETHMIEFGTAQGDYQDLVPGQKPFGIYIDRVAYVDDPFALPEAARQSLYRSIRTPILLKIRWKSGVEYLELAPESIKLQLP